MVRVNTWCYDFEVPDIEVPDFEVPEKSDIEVPVKKRTLRSLAVPNACSLNLQLSRPGHRKYTYPYQYMYAIVP